MKIIYNDEFFRQFRSDVTAVMDEMNEEISKVCEWDYGTNRVQTRKVREYLNEHLRWKKFKISEKPYSFNGIGNNARYDVLHILDENEREICGYININDLMYGTCAVYFEDFDNRRCGLTFKLSPRGITSQYKVYRGN